MMKRISLTGPESTGKSALSEALAKHYNTLWVPEYSRQYLKELDRDYEFDDIVKIAKTQYAREEEGGSVTSGYLFCDTDLLVNYIWSVFKYGKCDPWIEAELSRERYHLHLLCDIDLPWEEDPLREHPDQRKELFELYLHELQERNKPFHIIRGIGDFRLQNAISAIETFFGT